MTETVLGLGVFLAVNFIAASSGAIFGPGDWYERLRKPSWVPPNWAFPVVWSILYMANAVSGWLIWEAGGPAMVPALSVYVFSLLLNALWSALFFGLKRIDWAMAEVTALWLSILAVFLMFLPLDVTAALLQIPYLIWVTIAAALNLRMLQLNGARPA